jgi:hypothetical protein
MRREGNPAREPLPLLAVGPSRIAPVQLDEKGIAAQLDDRLGEAACLGEITFDQQPNLDWKRLRHRNLELVHLHLGGRGACGGRAHAPAGDQD